MPSLYPSEIPSHFGHPHSADIIVTETRDKGKAVKAKRKWVRGSLIARFDGITSPHVTQHSLQKCPGVHIIDKYFVGMLAHSCDPNVILDMDQQEVWALKDIETGDLLSMDYASTEDRLYSQFPCSCQAPNCRGIITGRKQQQE